MVKVKFSQDIEDHKRLMFPKEKQNKKSTQKGGVFSELNCAFKELVFRVLQAPPETDSISCTLIQRRMKDRKAKNDAGGPGSEDTSHHLKTQSSMVD